MVERSRSREARRDEIGCDGRVPGWWLGRASESVEEGRDEGADGSWSRARPGMRAGRRPFRVTSSNTCPEHIKAHAGTAPPMLLTELPFLSLLHPGSPSQHPLASAS